MRIRGYPTQTDACIGYRCQRASALRTPENESPRVLIGAGGLGARSPGGASERETSRTSGIPHRRRTTGPGETVGTREGGGGGREVRHAEALCVSLRSVKRVCTG